MQPAGSKAAQPAGPAPLRLGIAGLGTVGCGVLTLLERNGPLIAARAGRPLQVTSVSARSRRKKRAADPGPATWHSDPVALARDPEVDVVVELMGGSDGPARALCEAALRAGKPVVTANKALLAERGTALARLSARYGAPLAYEAAVAGGIPIIKALREGLAGNRIRRLYGILNGTCNYILTTMEATGRDFDDVLAEAQRLGYAEADPSFDVDGIDAAHKLAILAALAYGAPVDFASAYVEGIRAVTAADIAMAAELGFRIKLLGLAQLEDGALLQRVHPCLVPRTTPIAHVDGVYNAVVTEGDAVGRTLLEGRGAGAEPTASAVMADIIDIAAGRIAPPLGLPATALAKHRACHMRDHVGCYYVRLQVRDEPGVIADISAILKRCSISIESLLQHGRAPDDARGVPVVMTTHEAREAHMMQALSRMARLPSVLHAPHIIRIEKLTVPEES
ncbi:homoserine dehydrogenase [Marinibaculum pumilum]|uniref:Homoserine dehydrogenase n=1 Tax=Marinibaculum pumilum TaxID=1766165 RepID=A0ABV7KUM2_9PROT